MILGLILTGGVSGFLAGYISIGGAFVIVPFLTFLYSKYYTFSPSYTFRMVLATTLACMLFSSIISTINHNKRHNSIVWDYIRDNWIVIVLGSFLGVFLAIYIHVEFVKLLFVIYCFYSAIRLMVVKTKIIPNAEINNDSNLEKDHLITIEPMLPEQEKIIKNISFKNTKLVSFSISVLCGFIGIGGVNLVSSFLNKKGIEFKKSLSTSSAFQIFVATSGVISYIIASVLTVNKLEGYWLNQYILGYMNILSIFIISLIAFLINPLGVMMAHHTSEKTQKRVFAIFMLLVGIKMSYDLYNQYFLS